MIMRGLVPSVLLLLLSGLASCFESSQVCEPDCAGRECGLDPLCQLSCGSCAAGENCTAQGSCVPLGGDPGPEDGDGGVADSGEDGSADYDHANDRDDDGDAMDGNPGDGGDDDPCAGLEPDCYKAQTPLNPQGPDMDNDGWGICCDCNDEDATIHPWHLEVLDDQKDNDCNGLTDEPGGFLVRVPRHEGEVWIDAYEVSIFASPDCSGPQLGVTEDDYPAGWPADSSLATETLYACSLPGLVPSGYLSWYRARRACEAQGKRLCLIEWWSPACNGGSWMNYPYGGGYQPNACNDALESAGVALPTGQKDACTQSGATFDMSGNLAEWLQAWDDHVPGNALTAGYHYLCEICEYGSDCVPCADPPDQFDHDILELQLDCILLPEYLNPTSNYPREMTKPYLGTRCCYAP